MILRYPGGKFHQRQRILRHAPPDFQEFREPFVGGGHVFFSLQPGSVRRRWINDIDPDLIAVYRALRDRPADFIAACRALKPTRDLFEKFVAGDGAADPAVRYYFLNRTSWGGLSSSTIHPCFCYPAGWAVVRGDRLSEAARRLQGVEITAGDYTALLREPGQGVWVYCDAPYVQAGKDLYRHEFGPVDHTALSVDVRACKHKVLLSYDDDPLILHLYDGLTIYTVPAYYHMARQPEWGRELLIRNY
jgi:DNA adenine methylase